MKFTHLDWDSNFFGKRISRIDMEPEDSETVIMNEISSHPNTDLFYIFNLSNQPLELLPKDSKCKLVDIKMVYRLTVNDPDGNPQNNYAEIKIEDYPLSYTSVELENLAYQSGVYSRFRTDASFPAHSFYKLYKEWIDSCVSGRLADRVYISTSNRQTIGMVTVKFNELEARIGLIAVHEKFRGKHVGHQLLRHVTKESQLRNILHIIVSTQQQNEPACKLYERNGFVTHQVTQIYHYWR